MEQIQIDNPHSTMPENDVPATGIRVVPSS